MGSSLRAEDDRKKILFLLLIILFQWILYIQAGYDRETGLLTLSNPDTMTVLSIARSWVHGHPLQIIPGEPPSTVHCEFLSPLLFALGDLIGFKSLPHFIWWAYAACLITAVSGFFFLWRFYKTFLPEIAFPAVLLCIVFHGIFSNFFTTNFGFMFLFFWGAMACLHSFPLFLFFSILTALMRPEGGMMYLLLVSLYVSVNGRKDLWKFIPGIVPLCIPPILFKILTGSLLPQGVAPQNILHYQGLLEGISRAFTVLADQIKGNLLGFYPSHSAVGTDGSAWTGALAPMLFPLALLGIIKFKEKWLWPLILYLLFLLAGDSFTIYAGVHQNRHIHVLTPFFVGFALSFVKAIPWKGRTLFRLCVGFFLVIHLLQFYSSLSERRANGRKLAKNSDVVHYLLENHPDRPVLTQNIAPIYWMDGMLKLHVLFPSTDPFLGRHVRYHNRIVETSESIQRFYPFQVVFLDYPKKTLLTPWLLRFQTERLKRFTIGFSPYADAYLLDLSALRDTPPHGKPYSELDVGDPLSEEEHHYRYMDGLDRPVGSGLVKGEGFFDGGRPYVTAEDFDIDVPPEGGNLVCRHRGVYSGNRLDMDDHAPVQLRIRKTPFRVYADEVLVFDRTISFEKGFSYLAIPLDRGGTVHIRIEGLHHPFHYWIYG